MVPFSEVEIRNEQDAKSSTHLGVALKWTARFLIDVNDFTIRVTRQIDSNINIDLGHLFINFCL
jgi:hypothetical protein